MEHAFWHSRWAEGRIGFHRAQVNPHLLSGAGVWTTAQRVLVPLCGKSVDLWHLASLGHEVVGVELSPVAVEALFSEAGVAPTLTPAGAMTRWEGGGVVVYCGDFFDLEARGFTAFWDRAAMIALPPVLRGRYVEKLRASCEPSCVGLLLTLDGDGVAPSPPFFVDEEEVRRRYADGFEVHALSGPVATDAPAGSGATVEQLWCLRGGAPDGTAQV